MTRAPAFVNALSFSGKPPEGVKGRSGLKNISSDGDCHGRGAPTLEMKPRAFGTLCTIDGRDRGLAFHHFARCEENCLVRVKMWDEGFFVLDLENCDAKQATRSCT